MHFCGEKISSSKNIMLSSPFIPAVLGDKISTTFLQGNVKVINYLRLPKKNHIMFTAFLEKVVHSIDVLPCHANPKCLKNKFKALRSIDPTYSVAKKQLCFTLTQRAHSLLMGDANTPG